ncbi:hypothetical protein G7Z17_g5521 [Cylindrodendrum hubeiense]|uniref:Uncharacterized protein n=1 Tax=Cylindrodendrum hubeiense TaxID=595255 RepID=A0A9P5H6K6_9HYPO|nr:hypothetical protein G7Z17_g5521 [Cylindrodendrum hubeiense]
MTVINIAIANITVANITVNGRGGPSRRRRRNRRNRKTPSTASEQAPSEQASSDQAASQDAASLLSSQGGEEDGSVKATDDWEISEYANWKREASSCATPTESEVVAAMNGSVADLPEIIRPPFPYRRGVDSQ